MRIHIGSRDACTVGMGVLLLAASHAGLAAALKAPNVHGLEDTDFSVHYRSALRERQRTAHIVLAHVHARKEIRLRGLRKIAAVPLPHAYAYQPTQWDLGTQAWHYLPDVEFNASADDDTVSGLIKASALWGELPLGQWAMSTRLAPSDWSFAFTLGTDVDAQEWGRLRTGLTHETTSNADQWRYLSDYDFDVSERFNVALHHVWAAPSSLRRITRSSAGPSQHGISATWRTRRLGEARASFDTARSAGQAPVHQLGFSQEFQIGPRLRVGVDAHHRLGRPDYDIGLRFHLPLY